MFFHSVARYLSALTGPAEDHRLISRLFLKLLALIYLSAFVSPLWQITGLVGEHGLLPVGEFLDAARQQLGSGAWWRIPTLLWLDSSDFALRGLAIAGCGFSLLLLIGVWQGLSLAALFTLYLSLQLAGQVFFNFQWDYLLLESGFLAIFLLRGPTHLVILLYHWLLFRLRFLSGLSKLISGDPSWSGLTALKHYFETQPLPHVGSWYAHQLPEWMLQAGAAATLFAELVVPFLIFLPRPFRLFAAAVTILMQLLIIATSNHNFFNLLTILLCLFLLDDGVVRRILPAGWLQGEQRGFAAISRFHRFSTLIAALLIFSVSLASGYRMISGQPLPQWLAHWSGVVRSYGIGHVYHVFPTMQTERHELQVEGSMDGSLWRPYLFRYKPGPLERPPRFIVPHQPRLDWMIWFVPAHMPQSERWFSRFMLRLWEGEPEVTDLLLEAPFGDQRPRYLRVSVYRYRFTTAAERERSGDYWKRDYLGLFPEVPPRRP